MNPINREDDLFHNSYPRATALLLYGLLWLILVPVGLWLADFLFAPGSSLAANLMMASWAAALAGAAGAVTAMLRKLAKDLAVNRTFLQQPLFGYLIQPVVGIIMGLFSLYLISIPAHLLINYATSGQLLFAESFTSPTFTAVQLLLAWIAGFYQRQGLNRIKSALKSQSAEETGLTSSSDNEEEMLSYKQEFLQREQLRQWSYTWGIFILGYGVVWSVLLVATYLAWGIWPFAPELNDYNLFTALVFAAWTAVMAGSIGGVISMFNDLYWRVSFQQDFHRQHLMMYLVQPLVGASFGAAIYLFVAAGYLSLEPLFEAANSASKVVDAPSAIMIHLVLGWAAGFRQKFIGNLVQGLIQDLIDFARVAGKVLNPINLFNKAKRQKALEELSEKTDLFKPLAEESNSPEGFKWWAPD